MSDEGRQSLLEGFTEDWAPRWWQQVKNPPTSAGDTRHKVSIPGLGRSPGGGQGNPLQYSCLENPMDRGAWQAAAHGIAKNHINLKRLSVRMALIGSWFLTHPRTKSDTCRISRKPLSSFPLASCWALRCTCSCLVWGALSQATKVHFLKTPQASLSVPCQCLH